MRHLWYIVIPILAVQIYLGYFLDDGQPNLRRLPPQEHKVSADPLKNALGPTLKPGSPLDAVFTVDVGTKNSSIGTAFSVSEDGIWFTARHVVDGCDRVGLQVEKRRAIKVLRLLVHPKADIAILWTRDGRPGISIASAELRKNQVGYHIGYPEGRPGEVISSLIGRRNMRTVGRYRQVEPVVAWVERKRNPKTSTLGGLSGGPALNRSGEIVGVTVAASKRRGRVFTTARSSMDAILSLANIQPKGSPSGGLSVTPSTGTHIEYGRQLRKELIVAKVLCLIERSKRRRTISRGF